MMQPAQSCLETGVTPTGWEASLSLRFEHRGSRTVLASRRQRGPLAVQRPFYPEGDVCHLYLLHPPGGLVGGDRLEVVVDVAPGAAAMITTPGAAKFYRSLGPRAEQHQTLRVNDASLEWLPQENILFPGTDALLGTRVELTGEARFIGWEIHCLGLPSNQQRLDPGRASLGMEVWREGEPLLWDRLRVQCAEDLNGPSGLRGHPVIGTLIATGADDAALALARAAIQTAPDTHVGITRIQDLLIARALGPATDQVRGQLAAVWAAIRPPLLGRPAHAPRIWAT
jgi:urease accessory protein